MMGTGARAKAWADLDMPGLREEASATLRVARVALVVTAIAALGMLLVVLANGAHADV